MLKLQRVLGYELRIGTRKPQTELQLLALMERAHAPQMHTSTPSIFMCSGLRAIAVPSLEQYTTALQSDYSFIIFYEIRRFVTVFINAANRSHSKTSRGYQNHVDEQSSVLASDTV